MMLINEATGAPANVTVKELLNAGLFVGELDLPPAEYHALHAYLSNSQLKEFAKSPAHYQASLTAEHEREITGTGVHMRTLEPNRFARICVRLPGTRATKEGKAMQAEADATGGFAVTPAEYEKICRMSDAILEDPDCRRFIEGGKSEQSLFWKDPKSGVMLRCRPDYYRPDGIVTDLKYFNSVDEDELRAQSGRMNYHWQSKLYLDGLRHALGIGTNMFVHIYVTDKAPFLARPVCLSDASLDLAEHEVGTLLERFANCKLANLWPAFKRPDSGITEISLPDWIWGREV